MATQEERLRELVAKWRGKSAIFKVTFGDSEVEGAYLSCADELEQALSAAPPSKAQRVLESLTPGGSEFAGDPDACAAYVHKKISTLQDIAKNAVKARMAAAPAPSTLTEEQVTKAFYESGWGHEAGALKRFTDNLNAALLAASPAEQPKEEK